MGMVGSDDEFSLKIVDFVEFSFEFEYLEDLVHAQLNSLSFVWCIECQVDMHGLGDLRHTH